MAACYWIHDLIATFGVKDTSNLHGINYPTGSGWAAWYWIQDPCQVMLMLDYLQNPPEEFLLQLWSSNIPAMPVFVPRSNTHTHNNEYMIQRGLWGGIGTQSIRCLKQRKNTRSKFKKTP